MGRRREDRKAAADRTHAVTSGATSTTPAEANVARVVSSLNPAIFPREEWRSGLKERVLREASNPTQPHTGQGPGADDGAETPLFTATIQDDNLGQLIASDVEPITLERAQHIAAEAGRIAAQDTTNK